MVNNIKIDIIGIVGWKGRRWVVVNENRFGISSDEPSGFNATKLTAEFAKTSSWIVLNVLCLASGPQAASWVSVPFFKFPKRNFVNTTATQSFWAWTCEKWI